MLWTFYSLVIIAMARKEILFLSPNGLQKLRITLVLQLKAEELWETNLSLLYPNSPLNYIQSC